MNKQEAIGKIKNIDTLNINDIIAGQSVEMVIKNQVLNIISQIHEPQKVVLPKFVAEWIEEAKTRYLYLADALTSASIPTEVKDWLYVGEETFVRAWLDGYEIEQEKLYTVEIPNPNNTSPKYKLMLIKGINGVEILRDYYNEKRDPYIFQLTESEIKQDFEWAWQWAKPVEEEE